ncbi:hypothetical protein DICVIV_03896 [Dictyocaulus viviparus]|uniref:Uncharacterized protein n=1 Tax=Dictyocaulus viviparus TaxID=29172 RepID=A0A0D8Y1M5_DICVI|nr:hypothetical protein DICVIV_03896 [Dictyocaulus viviparus]
MKFRMRSFFVNIIWFYLLFFRNSLKNSTCRSLKHQPSHRKMLNRHLLNSLEALKPYLLHILC